MYTINTIEGLKRQYWKVTKICFIYIVILRLLFHKNFAIIAKLRKKTDMLQYWAEKYRNQGMKQDEKI